LSEPRLGLTLAPANAVGVCSQGVAVTAVDPDGPAGDDGMQSGDVILDVGGKVVSSPADVTQEVSDLQKAGKHTALMRVKSSQTYLKFSASSLLN
jgi:serine protease Do